MLGEARDSLIYVTGWALGRLPEDVSATYPSTQELAATPAMENIRRKFEKQGCRDDRYYSDYQYSELTSTRNVTGQIVGGSGADVSTRRDGLVRVHAFNTWGLESLTRFPGRGNRGNASIQQMLSGASWEYPKSIRENRSSGPGRNATVHYIWAEESPCGG